MLLTRKLLKQWNIFVKLKSSLRKCYRRHHDLVDSNGLFVLQWPQICSICRKYFPVLSAITIYYRVCNYINTTSATSGSWSTDPSGAPEFTPVFSGISVTWPFVLYVCFVGRCFSYCTFSFGHCVVCYSIYGFWLHIWYLQTLLSKVTWLELWTVNNFMGQHLKTFRIRTKTYFNSTRINFHRNYRTNIPERTN